MKTLKQILSSALLIALMVSPAPAQVSADVQQLFYRGYLTASKAPWKQAIQKIEQDESSELDKLKAITEAQTGLLVYALANQDKATYDEVAGKMESNLEILLAHNEKDARVLANMARLNGTTMAFKRWKAVYLSPMNEKLVGRALKSDPKSPEAWIQRGGALLFTPKMYGGDVDEAVAAFEKAVQYYETQPGHARNWRYLDALAWLGQAYQKADRPAEAAETFTKALEVEPDFGWVKYKLLPKAQASAK